MTISIYFIHNLTVWGVEPIVTHQTSWLESTGVCGVQQNQATKLNHHDPYDLSFTRDEKVWREKCFAVKMLGR
jgi:hypothetical protein